LAVGTGSIDLDKEKKKFGRPVLVYFKNVLPSDFGIYGGVVSPASSCVHRRSRVLSRTKRTT
jgi:hypothetical protein